MKTTLKIAIFFLLSSCSNYNEELSKQVLADVLDSETMKYDEMKIIPKLDSLSVERELKKIVNSKTLNFQSFNSTNFIELTKTEKTFLINEIRKQYKISWKDEDFENYKLLEENDKQYLEKSGNTTLTISKPIFLKNEEVAFLYYANYITGPKRGGHYKLAFYKKLDGKWKTWIVLSGAHI